MKLLWMMLVFLASLLAHAEARDWTVDYDSSKLTFIGDQSGEKFTGGFKKFQTWIAFDPQSPENGSISVTVDIASAYAGSSERDDMLPQKDWFDATGFPNARFVSSSIQKTGPTAYTVAGTLILKGVRRDVTIPFTLLREGDHWRAHGQVSLLRNSFGVGVDMFADESYVKNNVDVVIDIVAK